MSITQKADGENHNRIHEYTAGAPEMALLFALFESSMWVIHCHGISCELMGKERFRPADYDLP